MLLPCALSLAVLIPNPTPQVAEAPTPVAAVRIVDAEVSWDEVANWFLQTFGENHLRGLIQRIAIHREAAKQGYLPARETVEAEVERLIEERVRGAFDGDRAAWLDELHRLGDTEPARRASMMERAALDLELRTLVRESRQSEDAALRAAFEQRFGPGGLSLVLDAIILDVSYPTRGPNQSREEQRLARARAENEVRTRLLAHRDEIDRGDSSFPELASKVSEDEESRRRSGRLEDFDWENLTAEDSAAVRALPAGALSQPILLGGRWHLFRIADKVQADFEKERPELLQRLSEGLVSAPESSDWINSLLARTKVQVLPAQLGQLDSPRFQVDGQPFFQRDLAAYMLLHEGGALVRNFVAANLIETVANSAGIEIDADAIRARIREDIELQAQAETKGDLGAWESMLYQRSGMTREVYERQALRSTLTDLRAEALMLKDRKFSEAELRQAWEKKYGPDGKRREVRLLSVAIAPEEPGLDDAQRKLSYEKRAAAALKLATELRARALAGEDFAALCRAHSADGPSAQRGGRIEGWVHEQNWPDALVKTVRALPRGGFSEPIDFDGAGYLLFEVVKAEEHPFEELEDQLRLDLLAARPSAVRTAGWINERLEATDWSRLPGFWQESAKQFADLLKRAE